MRRSNLDMLSIELNAVKKRFDEIYDLYDLIQDDFRVDFHEIVIAEYPEQTEKS